MRQLLGTTPVKLVVATLFIALCAACSGGDGDDGGQQTGTQNFTATITNVDLTFVNDGIVGIQFSVSGPVNQVFSFLARYSLGGVEADASQIAPGNTQGLPTIPCVGLVCGDASTQTDGTGVFTGTFYWAAQQDLAFNTAGLSFSILPFSNGDPVNPNGVAGSSITFDFDPQNPTNPFNSNPSIGPGMGSGAGSPASGGTGRAQQTAHNVADPTTPGGNNILIAGGYNDGAAPNAFSSADRVNVDLSAGTHALTANVFAGGLQRVLHASAYYIDPATNQVKILITGGVTGKNTESTTPGNASLAGVATGNPTNATDIYSFSGGATDSLVQGVGMNVGRYAHSATWVPEQGAVVVAGGATNPPSPIGRDTVEMWSPHSPGAWTTLSSTLAQPRARHQAVCLADGRVLIIGGFDPVSPTTALACEVIDVGATAPASPVMTATITGATTADFGRYGFSVTRLFDGRVLIVGGYDLAGNLLANAILLTQTTFLPTQNPSFMAQMITLDRARALHSATLLGNGRVMISGGVAADGTNTGFTTSVQLFNPLVDTFTSTAPMTTKRGEHSATASASGSVFIIGGRNDDPGAGGPFLDDLEFYAFSNSVPAVVNPMTTAVAGQSGFLGVTFTIQDAETDGGFVVLRWRQAGSSNAWQNAVVSQQMGPNGVQNFADARGRVVPGEHTFVVSTVGLASGTDVEFQIIPVGATLGTPASFAATIP